MQWALGQPGVGAQHFAMAEREQEHEQQNMMEKLVQILRKRSHVTNSHVQVVCSGGFSGCPPPFSQNRKATNICNQPKLLLQEFLHQSLESLLLTWLWSVLKRDKGGRQLMKLRSMLKH